MESERGIAIGQLAEAIAADRNTWAADAEYAWAVQHINEAILHRNAFSGLDGMTAEHARAGLADYLTDHKQCSQRAYEVKLAAGLIFCTRHTDKGMVAEGSFVHGVGDSDYVANLLQKGYVDQVWPIARCPRRQEHKG